MWLPHTKHRPPIFKLITSLSLLLHEGMTQLHQVTRWQRKGLNIEVLSNLSSFHLNSTLNASKICSRILEVLSWESIQWSQHGNVQWSQQGCLHSQNSLHKLT